jgi:tRNA threonylcarbamoyladenosine modification (KEOPS) complex  Pcc1 subunit
MMPRYDATITMQKRSSINYKGLLGKTSGSKKGGIRIEENITTIKIIISAEDMASFRAAFNSITKDIGVIENVSKI